MQQSQNQSRATIAAIASPSGTGAVAIVRISGEQAIAIAEKVCHKSLQSCPGHVVQTATLYAADDTPIDRVLLVLFRAPRSYTGDDTVEIHCHGSAFLTKKVLQRIFEAGARPAGPGEFTRNAFLNGKLDLAQAEAVQLLIASQNDLAERSANEQLTGKLSQKIRYFQDQLTKIAAILEAWIDFPEEGLSFASPEEIKRQLETLINAMTQLCQTFHEGKMIHEGPSVCLVGTPNVGKSSLMNALLRSDRAIVTAIPGTTRDFLEEELSIGPWHIRLIDTAGIAPTHDPIEQEGIRRSEAARERADLCLLILDASRPLSEADQKLLARMSPTNTILVWNKIDLAAPPSSIPWHSTIHLSAKNGQGLEELQMAIQSLLSSKEHFSNEGLIICSLRHHNALSQAIQSCQQALIHLREGLPPECISIDLRAGLEQLGTIIGTNITEDILNTIFSQFCVGK